MEAVVMAAGEGRRLRPLTERFAKAVFPIDGQPVVSVLLRELVSAGLGPITIVVGRLGEQIETLLAGFDADLRFVRQPEALGSADAVRRAEADPPYVVVAADTVFSPGDVRRFVEATTGAAGAEKSRRRARDRSARGLDAQPFASRAAGSPACSTTILRTRSAARRSGRSVRRCTTSWPACRGHRSS